jgi:dTMP kinase
MPLLQTGGNLKGEAALNRHGLFITLEGIDGTGKTTQFRRLVSYLRRRGLPVVATREPGGTAIGEPIRRILLASASGGLAPFAELALFYAARAQHVAEVIRPALARGAIVVSDRYNDSSFAYQGYGRKLGIETVRAFDRIICGKTQPDLTLLLDQPPRSAIGRAQQREDRTQSRQGRFERQGLQFHKRARAGYIEIARKSRGRIRVIAADRPLKEIQKQIRKIVDEFLASRGIRKSNGF